MAAPETPLAPGEQVVKAGRANLQRGVETVGGRAWLTDQRLLFEAHAFNVQKSAESIQLSDIRTVRRAWTKFLGFVPIAYNSVLMTTADGGEHRLVTSRSSTWVAEIDRLRGVGS